METNIPPNVPPPIPPAQPPVFMAMQPQRRGGRGWMLLSIVLLGVLGAIVFGKAASAVFGSGRSVTGTESGHLFEEVTVENRTASQKIAVVDVGGMITSEPWSQGRSMVDLIEDQLKLAAKDDAVKAVIIKVDSPGGEVLASDDISRSIITFQEKHKKPVVCAMAGLAASGGYYVAAPCQWIVANELTITGSIGVIMSAFNYRGLMDKVGLQPRVYKSGKFKDMLRGSKRPEEVDPAEEKMVQDMIMETYGKFKSVVKNGRERAAQLNKGKGRQLAADWEQYADGRILTGKTAYDLGFVDQLGNFQTAVDKARELAGIDRAHLIRYQEPFTLSRLLMASAKGVARTANKGVKVDLGVDLPKVQAGRLYFLAPMVLE